MVGRRFGAYFVFGFKLRFFIFSKKCPNSIEETKLFKKIREIIVKNERNLLLETLDKISSNEIDIDKPNQYDLSDSF